MPKSIPRINALSRQKLKKVIVRLAAMSGAEKIYCYGCRRGMMTCWSPFQPQAHNHRSQLEESYDLVMIMPAHEQRTRNEIFDGMDKRKVFPLNINVLVFYLPETIDLVKKGDRFMCQVLFNGVLLYSRNKKPLANATAPLPDGTGSEEAELRWQAWMDTAYYNLNLAKQRYAAGRYKSAMGSLYLAALQTGSALLYSYTGHEAGTPRLDQLLSLCDNFCLIRKRVFPQNMPEEWELLAILSDVGYRDEKKPPAVYKLTRGLCESLVRRVDLLYTLATGYLLERDDTAGSAGLLIVDGSGTLTHAQQ